MGLGPLNNEGLLSLLGRSYTEHSGHCNSSCLIKNMSDFPLFLTLHKAFLS